MARFHVVLDGPQNGWFPIRIIRGDVQIEIIASYTPTDSVTEFVEAIHHTYNTGSPSSVVFNEEPETIELSFSRESDSLVIDSLGSHKTTTIRTSFETGCREFARKFILLIEETGYDGYVKEWRHRPPKQSIRDFWANFS